MTFWTNKKILVTGGFGFLGSHLVNELVNQGADPELIIVPRSKYCDLRKWENCVSVVQGIDLMIHLAGNVGGIGYNQKHPADLFYDNAIMGIHLIEAARLAKVEKSVIIGTVCAYPKFTKVPFKEDDIWDGYPEETNAPYGLAKKMLLIQSQAYREQYGMNTIYLLLVNLYGPGDNFNPDSSHVIPALIKKFVAARDANESSVEVWGTGSASREFVYVKDAVRGIAMAAEIYQKPEPVNLGSGMEISIKDLVKIITKKTGYSGEVVWDISKPDGQPRRCLDISRAKLEFGYKAEVSFEQGLDETIKWYEGVKDTLSQR